MPKDHQNQINLRSQQILDGSDSDSGSERMFRGLGSGSEPGSAYLSQT